MSPEAEFIALCDEWARRAGRRVSLTTHPGAAMVRALVERHGCSKTRAIEIVHLTLWGYAGEAIIASPRGRRAKLAKITRAALERAYQKLMKSGRVAFVDDRDRLMRAALARLKAEPPENRLFRVGARDFLHRRPISRVAGRSR